LDRSEEGDGHEEVGMDVTVTPAAEGTAWGRNAWELTDLLGRSMGRIVEEPHDRFTIQPGGRARETMARIALGPYPSLDAALAEIENHTHGVCRRAPEGT
jgi:hypothetical protein